MAVIRSRRVRDAGMGGLVQQPAALGAHRQHPARRSRGTLLRHAGTTCHGGVTQTKWPPTNRGRFKEVGGAVALVLVIATGWASRFHRDRHARLGEELL